MIRLGLIGCGEHSESGHAIPLARYKKEHPGAIELNAVCDVRLERAELFCSKFGFLKPYTDLDGMLAQEELDGCIAVVPVALIPQVGTHLLRRGVPCVLEYRDLWTGNPYYHVTQPTAFHRWLHARLRKTRYAALTAPTWLRRCAGLRPICPSAG